MGIPKKRNPEHFGGTFKRNIPQERTKKRNVPF